MSGKIELLDCTLRDGAYIVKAKFGTPVIKGIISHMQDAGAEIVECGWLKNTPHEPGTSFYHVPHDIEQYLVERRDDVTYVVMIDWDRYDVAQLPPYDGKSIDAIRVVFPHGKHKEAIKIGLAIKKLGYRLFFQAANTLAYSNEELVELAEDMNEAAPESLSIVDTFGAMFHEDLERIAAVLNEKLAPQIKIGYHSHNNQQLSFALSMRFVELMQQYGRDLVVDASLCGMGRGAGNATTELMAGYLNRKMGKKYDLSVILDAIDVFMEYFKKNYSWGYSTPYFISGMYCTHVNNIAYLIDKHRVRAKDMRGIIESLPPQKRLVYDYDLLENKYIGYYEEGIDSKAAISFLGKEIAGRPVLMLCSGHSLVSEEEKIKKFIAEKNPVVIGINAMFPAYDYDSCFFSNAIRYAYMKMEEGPWSEVPKIISSNVKEKPGNNEYIVGFNELIKREWKYFDNAGIMCLRLLKLAGAKAVFLAGFDGFRQDARNNYADMRMPSVNADEDWDLVNREISDMLKDLKSTLSGEMFISFVTRSLFSEGEIV